ncbi:lysophospholipid acyltransferase family protein [Actinoallomurus sp. CA-150999]|uniref:lysophospholipid acyltransferase family protein n=1 Tax=Actinoallomurus sp. CA-150999 TaxID=3239887 RepID=UPI003D93D00B
MSEEARAEMRHEAEVIPLHGDKGADRQRGDRGTEPPGELEQKIAGALRFVRHRLSGDYQVDEFGFDPELNDRLLMPMARQLYERWFRVEMLGLENVPDEGPALVVGNHSGTLPLDGVMLQVGLHDHHPAKRNLRLLGADLVYQIPVLAHLARKSGHTLACQADAARLLGKRELVGVFPEGFKGVGKPYSQRYKLQRFGRGGFVATALRAQVPIIPAAIVGAEEIYPKIADLRPIARLFGLPYFPITPTWPMFGLLGLVPLPSKWIVAFGEPIMTDEYAPDQADDHMTVLNLTDQVRETIQNMLYDLLRRRASIFF